MLILRESYASAKLQADLGTRMNREDCTKHHSSLVLSLDLLVSVRN